MNPTQSYSIDELLKAGLTARAAGGSDVLLATILQEAERTPQRQPWFLWRNPLPSRSLMILVALVLLVRWWRRSSSAAALSGRCPKGSAGTARSLSTAMTARWLLTIRSPLKDVRSSKASRTVTRTSTSTPWPGTLPATAWRSGTDSHAAGATRTKPSAPSRSRRRGSGS